MDKSFSGVEPKRLELFRVQYSKMELVPIDVQMGLGDSSYLLTTEESILLNRNEETLSMGQKNNLGSDVVQYWHVPDAVPALMDRCQAHLEDLTVRKEAIQVDVPAYTMEMMYRDGTMIEISGLFMENDLPVGWAPFAREIAEFIKYHGVESLMLRAHAS